MKCKVYLFVHEVVWINFLLIRKNESQYVLEWTRIDLRRRKLKNRI